jgi:hypothetical protein
VKYDFPEITRRREMGASWAILAIERGVRESTIRGAYSRWRNDQPARLKEAKGGRDSFFDRNPSPPLVHHMDEPLDYMSQPESTADLVQPDAALLSSDDVSRITNLEDLVSFFKVDTEKWQVNSFRVNKWEQSSVKLGIVPLYQVRATLGRNMERDAEIAATTYELAREELREAGTRRPSAPTPPARIAKLAPGEPCILEIAVFDPHIGMYGWAQEVGEDYDSGIAVRRYVQVVEQALSVAHFYNVERILFVAGNDLSHVDALGVQQKGGTTTAGTAQDFDSRLPKVFSAIRRAVVAGIDMARLVAPVDVLVVPGNHDEQTTYKLGEVLQAWYRNDPAVDVKYDVESEDEAYWPRRRQYYRYGKNAFMFTHGMEYKRKRDPLPLLFATEAPPAMWAATTHREVHTGHNHIRMSGRYAPEADVTETRAIITRSLPGLTPEDAWHYQQGYRHQQAGTALVFRRSGGIAGLHEFTPEV